MTFSIVARDPATGDLAVAVQSKFMAVGSVVPWAKAGVGAVATQSFANVTYGPGGLDLLTGGGTAQEVLDRLVAADPLRQQRQAGIVDAHGGATTHTGRSCLAWAGGRTGDGFAAQGNILAGPGVVDGLADTYLAGGRPFPELLVDCLQAADAAGGDRRGRQSAALLVVRAGAGYGGGNDRWIDLNVDDHPDPIGELGRLLSLTRLYFDHAAESDLVPLDPALAAEIQARLRGAGWDRGRPGGSIFAPMWPDEAEPSEPEVGRPAIGTPRPLPDGWDQWWQDALVTWMSVENLEERIVAPGWIDPAVLKFLRNLSTP